MEITPSDACFPLLIIKYVPCGYSARWLLKIPRHTVIVNWKTFGLVSLKPMFQHLCKCIQMQKRMCIFNFNKCCLVDFSLHHPSNYSSKNVLVKYVE